MSYEFDLDTQLGTMVSMYEDDRNQKWAAAGVDSAIFSKIDAYANWVLKSAEDMVERPDRPDLPIELAEELRDCMQLRDQLRALRDELPAGEKLPAILANAADGPWRTIRPDDDSKIKLLWERFCIKLAWAMADTRLPEGGIRLLNLMDVFVVTTPSRTTRQFLGRVSRCYVWGFDTECIAFCRSVVDAAFRDRVPDGDCREIDQPAARYGYTLAQRVYVAHRTQLIDDRIKDAATRVIERANKAIHYEPLADVCALATIKDALQVVEALCGNRPAR